MGLNRRGWTLVSVLLMVLAAAPAQVPAQLAQTVVQDTVYSADGSPAQGTVIVSWPAFTTASGSSVVAGTTSATLAANGMLTISLAPNAGATPLGTYYTAVFHLSDGTTSQQFWVVPVTATSGAAPVNLAAVQNNVLPTSVALQTVSKSYVDTAIAQALTGNSTATTTTGTGTTYVPVTGGTMTGPLVLPGNPVSPLQAADKNYVDTDVAQVAGSLATKVSTVPSVGQSVTQPGGTQLEVNSLNGVLDATGFLSGTGNNGFGNALASANCAGGCNVRASATYPGADDLPALASLPSGSQVSDERGGSRAEVRMNPMSPGAGEVVGSSIAQMTTETAPQFALTHPGTAGEASYVMELSESAPAGGNNLLPGGPTPYGKSTYGVLGLSGKYNTQGQHVQFSNQMYCYGVGDCLAGGQFITSSGGYRDAADEGSHPFDLLISEDTSVYQGTCATGCSTGSTALVVAATAGAGTQGDGRYLIDKNPSKVISTGSIAGAPANTPFQAVQFTGTTFPLSVFLAVSQPATAQGGSMAPGTVTLPLQTTNLTGGYATSTAALPAMSGVACVADGLSVGSIPNFEMAPYSVVDATHLKLTLNKVHSSGATVSVGGVCGYGLEQTADTVNQLRQIFPVMGAIQPAILYYAGANSSVVGLTNGASTGGYLNASLPITSLTRSSNTVTVTTSSAMSFDLNGLQLTVAGVADASFNGTFAITTTSANTFTYTDQGADGSSTGGTASVVTGGYNLYPMAEVLSVFDATSGTVDGTLTLGANTVAWAQGDPLEMPHYYQQLVNADEEFVTQYLPRPLQYASSGKEYQGTVGPGLRGWAVSNNSPGTNYLGGGGTHQPPDDAFFAGGVWRNTFEVGAGQEALLRIHCNLAGCNRWDSTYALFGMDSHQGEDFLFYNPSTNQATWALGGAEYVFSPQSFHAGVVEANTLTLDGSTTIAGTANVAGAATVGGTLSMAGGAQVESFLGGTWIDMPTTGPSALGAGGAGNDAWIAYAAGAGYFFPNAQAGDLVYRNSKGAMLFGNDPANSAEMRIANSTVQFGEGQQANFNQNGVLTVPAVVGTAAGPSFQEVLYTPSSSSAGCTAGQFADDANFHYVCVAANTWKRVALSSF